MGWRSKNNNFLTQFCLRYIFNKFDHIHSIEISLNGNEYYFSVDYNLVDKSDIVNIEKLSHG